CLSSFHDIWRNKDNFHLWRHSGTQQTFSPKTKFPLKLKAGVMASGKDVVLRYVAVAWWRPAFNLHRDNGILLPFVIF
ncbi:hypothetical protein Tco_1413786, partial [Tanacetum coccineum]